MFTDRLWNISENIAGCNLTINLTFLKLSKILKVLFNKFSNLRYENVLDWAIVGLKSPGVIKTVLTESLLVEILCLKNLSCLGLPTVSIFFSGIFKTLTRYCFWIFEFIIWIS